jgi:hypothetical protein
VGTVRPNATLSQAGGWFMIDERLTIIIPDLSAVNEAFYQMGVEMAKLNERFRALGLISPRRPSRGYARHVRRMKAKQRRRT